MSDTDDSGPSSPEILVQQTPSTSDEIGRKLLFKPPPLSDKTNVTTNELILEEVKKTNTFLAEFSTRMDAMETRLKIVEQQQKDAVTPSSIGDSSVEKAKNKVPTRVRHEVRDVYRTLLDEDDFDGFALKKRFTDKENQDVVKCLCGEMKTLDTSISPAQVRVAARRFFQTKLEEDSLKRKGKYDEKVRRQRKKNRIKRKLDLRTSTLLNTTSVPEEQKDLAKQILTKDFMFSESSGIEQLEDGTERPVIVVKPLQWRGAKATRFLKRLDTKVNYKKSKQSIQQTLPRVIGENSIRPKPNLPDNFWGFIAK